MGAVAAILAMLLACLIPGPAGAFVLPDTDQRICYRPVEPYDRIPCAGTGQDGEYVINPPGYTDNLDSTVTDNNTGLMWQREEAFCSECQIPWWSEFNWYVASGTYDADHNPNAVDYCGSLTLGGYTDWRLPSRKEWESIVEYSIPYPGPTIDTDYFTSSLSSVGVYWTTTVGVHAVYAWYADIRLGCAGFGLKEFVSKVRCVRSVQSPQALTGNSDGTVTDGRTGLTWQQGEPGCMTWGEALAYCEGLVLGGSSSWRLPNVKELGSLIDETREDPPFNTAYFPGAARYYYYTSTTISADPGNAWEVDSYGQTGSFDVWGPNKDNCRYVRCVRGGETVLALEPIGEKVVLTGQPLVFTISAVDPDGGPFLFSVAELPAGAIFDDASATFSWTPASDQAGAYCVNFSVTDGVRADGEDVIITVTEPPGSISGTITTGGPPLSGVVEIQVYNQEYRPAGQASTDASHNYQYSIAGLAPGSYKVRFDPLGTAFAREWYSDRVDPFSADAVVVTAGQDTPGVDAELEAAGSISGSVSSALSTPLSGTVHISVYDLGGHDVWSVSTDASHNYRYSLGNLRAGSYKVLFLPANGAFAQEWYLDKPDFNSADIVTVVAGQDKTGIDAALDPGAGNRAPVLAVIGDRTVVEGQLLSFVISGSDPDNDLLTFSAGNLPSGAAFDQATRNFTWTPGYDQSGVYAGIHFQVTDGSLGDSEDITITVNNVNQPPVLDPIGGKTVIEGQRISFTVTASDPDGDSVTFSASGPPAGASFDPATATFTWMPTLLQAGTYMVTFTVSDGVLSDAETVTITVEETYSIKGRIVTYLGAPLRRASVKLTPEGGTTVITRTTSLGRFSFEGLPGNTTYVLKPVKTGWYFKPRRKVVLIETASKTKQNFVALPL